MKRARGFTLIEVLVALVLLGIVMAATIRTFRGMSSAVADAVDRMDAMQNLRFGVTTLDREARAAGAGVADIQPTLVYASATVAAFNADLVSRIPNSATAVYYNPDADPNAVSAPTLAQRFTIPTTTMQYPDSAYRSGGALSPAETVVYYLAPDTSTARADDYVLMRQVNNSPPDIVARNLLAFPGRDFFEWLRTDSAGNLVAVPGASLPLTHANPVHGSLSDTSLGAAGAKRPNIDSIRALRVNLYATNGQSGAREVRRWLVTTIRIPNAGLTKQRSCGDAPIFAGSVGANFTGTPDAPVVTVSWNHAVDEGGGENDVERYLIYRRTASGAFADALQVVPAGQSSYTYADPSVANDSSYVYGVTALDCTPLESSLATSGTVTIPPHP